MIRTHNLFLCVLVLSALAAPLAGQEAPATAPATVPATAPAAEPAAPATAPATGGANWSSAAVGLTDREKTALQAVRDRNSQLAETAFYMMLARAAQMPPLTPEQFQELEQPSYKNLLADPVRYRAQPIRMTVSVFTGQKFMPSPTGSFPVNPNWPKDKPVWYLTALNSPLKPDKDQPLMIYSVIDPTAVLGPPSATAGEEMRFEGLGRRVEVAGLFYKLRTGASHDGEQVLDYPVLLVYQIPARLATTGKPGESGQSLALFVALGTVLAVLGYGFFLLKRRVKKLKDSGGGGQVRYKPLRDQDQDKAPEPSDQEGEVDPLLKQAAEQFQKERQEHGDGPS